MMAKKILKDLNESKGIHALAREHKVNRIVLPLAALYVVFLIMTVMFNFGIFAKAILITFVVLFTYFLIATSLDIRDWYKRRHS
ncbi:hypothetical protein EQ500_07995 [Lactobacillus sp. XV13L]|nr:hypothetical protein [Lactobacillus sp. XV13L]